MFKTIFMTAAAFVATAAAVPAYADGPGGTGGTNGRTINGIAQNGEMPNGGGENGLSPQRTSTGVVRFVIDGIELPARSR